MAEQRAEGALLGRLVKQAKKQPMSFAFCPGPTDDGDVLLIHRHKKPEILAKIARDESAGTKTAFGTLAVTGKTVLLTCQSTLPAMAKQLHRYMKNQKQPMEVRLVDTEADSRDEENGDETGALVARLKVVQSGLSLMPDAQRGKLKAALQGAVKLIKSGDMDKAKAAIDIMENVLSRSGNAPRRDPGI